MTERGVLIALEGGEACGKSTQAAILAESLGAVLTREPGGTALGAALRGILLGRGDAGIGVGARAEALLMVADRAQHVEEVVRPALEEGGVVVTDRFTGSTLAYQGFGRGLEMEMLEEISTWACNGLEADLTVLLEVPRTQALSRRPAAGDRIEAEDSAFFERVETGYRDVAKTHEATWVVVDGQGSVAEVAARVLAAVVERLGPVHPARIRSVG